MVVFDLLTQRCQNHFSSFTGFFNIQAVAFLQAQESRGVFLGGGEFKQKPQVQLNRTYIKCFEKSIESGASFSALPTIFRSDLIHSKPAL